MFYVSVFIKVLLHNIGTHVDPIILIDKIKEGMEIEGLRDSLVKILQDYHLQVINYLNTTGLPLTGKYLYTTELPLRGNYQNTKRVNT